MKTVHDKLAAFLFWLIILCVLFGLALPMFLRLASDAWRVFLAV